MESLNTATELAPNSVLAWASYANACKYAGKTEEQSRATEKAKHLIEQNKSKQPEEREPLPEAVAAEPTSLSLQDIVIPE